MHGAGRDISALTDVYGIGAVLVALVTGTPTNSDAVQPAPFAKVCKRCLEKKPGKRYANAAEVAETLRPFAE